MMDVMASPIHLKLKYHNFHNEPITIYGDLSGARRIHKDLQRDQNGKDNEKVMEINMASLTKQLKEMKIKPLKRMDQGY